ncbi:hypothetical protein HY374_00740 [Candidatus Berkelbacteria bacterium]|nr:hypothetical protein [Candidatus Berkelbacteria bacterium]
MPVLNKNGRVISAMPRLFWVVLVVLVAAGAAAFAIFRPAEVTHQNNDRQPVAAAQELLAQNPAEANRDDDADGLKNWGEALWGADPKNADTDGDGTPDGTETRESRDPTKPGPNDHAAPLVKRLAEFDPTGEEPNLTTELAAKINGAVSPNLLSRIKNGARPEDIGELFSAISTSNVEKIFGPIETVKANELAVSPASGTEAVRTYFNAVYDVYAATLVKLPADDLAILVLAVQANDFSKLGQIDAVIAALDQSIRQVKALAVPKGYEEFAVRELNYLLRTRRLVSLFRRADQDPLAAMIAAQLRVDLMGEVRKFHEETGRALAAKGITFDTSESGYQLFY